MKRRAEDFARYQHWQGLMGRFDFHRLTNYGSRIYGLSGKYSNVLFATDALGRFIWAEAFPANMNEYQCLINSGLYRIIGGAAPQPAVENRVPLFECRKGGDCKEPSGPFACYLIYDNNGDMCAEMLLGNVIEPHFLSPFPKLWEYYRCRLSGTALAFNKKLENTRMPIESRMSSLNNKFQVLNDPIKGFGEDRGYVVYNQLLEALCAVNNEGLALNRRPLSRYQDASDQNRIEWADATPHGPDRLANWAIMHVCDCEMAVEEQLPPHSWYPSRNIEIVDLLFQPSPQMQFIERVYTRGLQIDWNPAPLQPNEAQVTRRSIDLHEEQQRRRHAEAQLADMERQLTYMRHRLHEEQQIRRHAEAQLAELREEEEMAMDRDGYE